MGYTAAETKPAGHARGRARKVLAWLAGILVIVLAVGVIGYKRTFRDYPPGELMQDIRAGVAARDIRDPNERFVQYLENRYGSMDDPANRQTAFLAFFDPEHIRALQWIATHAPKEQRQANIQASANWVAQYRNNLTPAERTTLAAQLNSQAGVQMLRKATAQYNSQDIYYRGQTAVVISELLTTIRELKQNNP